MSQLLFCSRKTCGNKQPPISEDTEGHMGLNSKVIQWKTCEFDVPRRRCESGKLWFRGTPVILLGGSSQLVSG